VIFVHKRLIALDVDDHVIDRPPFGNFGHAFRTGLVVGGRQLDRRAGAPADLRDLFAVGGHHQFVNGTEGSHP
jgi:hypothetical protein